MAALSESYFKYKGQGQGHKIIRVSLPNMKSSSLRIQILKPRMQLTIIQILSDEKDKETGQKPSAIFLLIVPQNLDISPLLRF